ncbi:MAG: aminopeptidase P family protein [Deferrisomatales bacterium]
MATRLAEGYTERAAAALQLLAGERLDALLVLDLLNVRYLCGFTGSNGLLVLLGDRRVFFTDSRYTLQAREETVGVEVVETADLDRSAAGVLSTGGARYVGFQPTSITAARRARLGRLLEADLVDVGTGVDRLRVCKGPDETRRLEAAARLAEEALRFVAPLLCPGRTELEVARAFHVACLERGAEGLSFDTIVAGGPRGALPHAKPTGRPFEAGDLVLVDFGVRLDGYCSDQTVTVPVGPPAEDAAQVYGVVFQAQRAALEALRPGVALAEVDRAARDVIAAAGHGERFGHGTGHGVGLAVHEAPTVSSRSGDAAQEGAVVTIEPGIYLPGRFGVRLEDTVRVTSHGYERITSVPKELGAFWDWVGGR